MPVKDLARWRTVIHVVERVRAASSDLYRRLSESPFGEPMRLEPLRRTRRMVLEVVPEEMGI